MASEDDVRRIARSLREVGTELIVESWRVKAPAPVLAALAHGAQWYLSSEGNLTPRLCVSLIERYDAADFDAVACVHASIMHLSTATQALGGIVGAKAALQALGAPGGWPRPPRLPVTAARAQLLIDLIIVLEPLGSM